MFTFNVEELQTDEVIYSISHGGWLYYVGRCRLPEFAQLPDARWHSEVGPRLKNEQFAREAVVMILATGKPQTATSYDALDKHWAFVNSMNPQFRPEPKPIVRTGRKTREVLHVRTGQIYASASEVCREFGIAASNMSNHLNGMIGHVKGEKFIYLDEERSG